MRAWQLCQLGWKQRLIADALGVSEGAVSHWVAKARDEGPAALLVHHHPGPAAKHDTAKDVEEATEPWVVVTPSPDTEAPMVGTKVV